MVNWINNTIEKLTEMLKEAGIYSVNRVVPVGLITLTGNKWTNSKYNTGAGAPGKPLAPTEYKPMAPLMPTLPSKEVTDTAKKVADGLDKVASKL